MRAVLISGLPATGKTCFGEWLASDRGFQHLDLEKGNPARLNPFGMESLAFIDEARAGRPDLVSSASNSAQTVPAPYRTGSAS